MQFRDSIPDLQGMFLCSDTDKLLCLIASLLSGVASPIPKFFDSFLSIDELGDRRRRLKVWNTLRLHDVLD
jgi:hypothetical protein